MTEHLIENEEVVGNVKGQEAVKVLARRPGYGMTGCLRYLTPGTGVPGNWYWFSSGRMVGRSLHWCTQDYGVPSNMCVHCSTGYHGLPWYMYIFMDEHVPVPGMWLDCLYRGSSLRCSTCFKFVC